jgi:hypothetical protein
VTSLNVRQPFGNSLAVPSTRKAGVPHAFDDPWIDFRSGRMASASENCVTHFADAFRFLLERTIALAAGRRWFGARTPRTIRSLVLALCLLASAGAADAALAQLEFRAASALPDGPMYGCLTLEQTAPGTVQLVASLGDHWSNSIDYGISSLWFILDRNLQPQDISTPDFILSITDVDGFGRFSYKVAALSQAPGPTLGFSITQEGLSIAEFLFSNPQGWVAAMEIVAFDGPPGPGGVRPIAGAELFAAAVPAPSGWLLSIAGLLALSVLLRRRAPRPQ